MKSIKIFPVRVILVVAVILASGTFSHAFARDSSSSDKRTMEFVTDLDLLNRLFEPSAKFMARLFGKPTTDTAVVPVFDLVPTNTTALSNVFPFRLSKTEDAFKVRVQMDSALSFDAPTHLFGRSINIIPYGDGDDVKDAAGNSYRGDAAVSRYYPPNEIGFAIKHHRPFHRMLDLNDPSEEGQSKNDIKLQDTHIEIVVGVMRDGGAGVVTVNNPQNYQSGGFGDDNEPGDYPMIFTKPAFPRYLPNSARQLMVDNIRTMAVGFNTVSRFPSDYDGGDPLSATTPGRVRELVKMMIKAVAGDSDAAMFFEKAENHMYCAELAFIATTAGLLVPLNQANVTALGVTEDEWAVFKREVQLHNRHDADAPSFFVKNNENERIALIELADLDKLNALKPLPQYAPRPEAESAKLAFKPLTMADMVESFLRIYIPRKELGEKVAAHQARALTLMKPGLMDMLALDPASPEAASANTLFEQIVKVVGREHSSYEAFRRALSPLLEKARSAVGNPETGQGLFTPPSLFHLVLLEQNEGLIGLDYVGHGLHFSILKPR